MTSGLNLAIPPTVYRRVRARVIESSAGCWEWTGAINERGYGRTTWTEDGIQRRVYVHRLVWLVERGPIADGLELDHLCRNKICCNPDHLEPVISAENVRRAESYKIGAALQRAKTHCPYGHPYDEENTYLIPTGGRGCRECKRDDWRRRQKWKGGLPHGERTHCPYGHEYSPENTYVNPKGARVCRTCCRARQRQYARERKRKKAAR